MELHHQAETLADDVAVIVERVLRRASMRLRRRIATAPSPVAASRTAHPSARKAWASSSRSSHSSSTTSMVFDVPSGDTALILRLRTGHRRRSLQSMPIQREAFPTKYRVERSRMRHLYKA